MPLQFELLQIIVNPNISFLLLLIGLAGIGFEIFNPARVPGALGSVSLLLGLFGTAQLPVTIVGVVADPARRRPDRRRDPDPERGARAAGVVSLAAGGLLLYDTDGTASASARP